MAVSDSQTGPDFHFERVLTRNAGGPVAGVDEAGRGPWAGPVVAAAVILDPENIPEGLDDSKKLTAGVRDRLFGAIENSAAFAVAIADVDEIDRLNILRATLAAMRKAVISLPVPPAAALIDGNKSPQLPCRIRTLIKGDGRSLSIAAASIVAKVTRDRIMDRLATEHPGYGWERNKGYGTAEHRTALARLGVTVHHRRSFRPVRRALAALTTESAA